MWFSERSLNLARARVLRRIYSQLAASLARVRVRVLRGIGKKLTSPRFPRASSGVHPSFIRASLLVRSCFAVVHPLFNLCSLCLWFDRHGKGEGYPGTPIPQKKHGPA